MGTDKEIAEKGLTLVKSFETCKLEPYDDGYGYMTIGWGHLIKPGESFGSGINQERADQLLVADLAIAMSTVNHAVAVDITQNQFDALVSFAFNAGGSNFRSSTLLKKVNQGNLKGAANEFDKWIHSAGKVSKGLIRRRAAEKALFQEI